MPTISKPWPGFCDSNQLGLVIRNWLSEFWYFADDTGAVIVKHSSTCSKVAAGTGGNETSGSGKQEPHGAVPGKYMP